MKNSEVFQSILCKNCTQHYKGSYWCQVIKHWCVSDEGIQLQVSLIPVMGHPHDYASTAWQTGAQKTKQDQ